MMSQQLASEVAQMRDELERMRSMNITQQHQHQHHLAAGFSGPARRSTQVVSRNEPLGFGGEMMTQQGAELQLQMMPPAATLDGVRRSNQRSTSFRLFGGGGNHNHVNRENRKMAQVMATIQGSIEDPMGAAGDAQLPLGIEQSGDHVGGGDQRALASKSNSKERGVAHTSASDLYQHSHSSENNYHSGGGGAPGGSAGSRGGTTHSTRSDIPMRTDPATAGGTTSGGQINHDQAAAHHSGSDGAFSMSDTSQRERTASASLEAGEEDEEEDSVIQKHMIPNIGLYGLKNSKKSKAGSGSPARKKAPYASPPGSQPARNMGTAARFAAQAQAQSNNNQQHGGNQHVVDSSRTPSRSSKEMPHIPENSRAVLEGEGDGEQSSDFAQHDNNTRDYNSSKERQRIRRRLEEHERERSTNYYTSSSQGQQGSSGVPSSAASTFANHEEGGASASLVVAGGQHQKKHHKSASTSSRSKSNRRNIQRDSMDFSETSEHEQRTASKSNSNSNSNSPTSRRRSREEQNEQRGFGKSVKSQRLSELLRRSKETAPVASHLGRKSKGRPRILGSETLLEVRSDRSEGAEAGENDPMNNHRVGPRRKKRRSREPPGAPASSTTAQEPRPAGPLLLTKAERKLSTASSNFLFSTTSCEQSQSLHSTSGGMTGEESRNLLDLQYNREQGEKWETSPSTPGDDQDPSLSQLLEQEDVDETHLDQMQRSSYLRRKDSFTWKDWNGLLEDPGSGNESNHGHHFTEQPRSPLGGPLGGRRFSLQDILGAPAAPASATKRRRSSLGALFSFGGGAGNDKRGGGLGLFGHGAAGDESRGDLVDVRVVDGLDTSHGGKKMMNRNLPRRARTLEDGQGSQRAVAANRRSKMKDQKGSQRRSRMKDETSDRRRPIFSQQEQGTQGNDEPGESSRGSVVTPQMNDEAEALPRTRTSTSGQHHKNDSPRRSKRASTGVTGAATRTSTRLSMHELQQELQSMPSGNTSRRQINRNSRNAASMLGSEKMKTATHARSASKSRKPDGGGGAPPDGTGSAGGGTSSSNRRGTAAERRGSWQNLAALFSSAKVKKLQVEPSVAVEGGNGGAERGTIGGPPVGGTGLAAGGNRQTAFNMPMASHALSSLRSNAIPVHASRGGYGKGIQSESIGRFLRPNMGGEGGGGVGGGGEGLGGTVGIGNGGNKRSSVNVFAVQQNLMEDLTMDQDHEMTEHDRKLNPRPMVVTQEQLSNDLNARRQSTESTTRAGIGTNANRCGGGVGPPGPRVSTPTADFDPHAGGGGSILRESGSRTNYLSQMGSFMSLTGSTTVGGTGGGGGTASAAAASGAGARLSYGGGGAPGSVRDSGNSLLQGRDSAGGALGLPVRASESNSQRNARLSTSQQLGARPRHPSGEWIRHEYEVYVGFFSWFQFTKRQWMLDDTPFFECGLFYRLLGLIPWVSPYTTVVTYSFQRDRRSSARRSTATTNAAMRSQNTSAGGTTSAATKLSRGYSQNLAGASPTASPPPELNDGGWQHQPHQSSRNIHLTRKSSASRRDLRFDSEAEREEELVKDTIRRSNSGRSSSPFSSASHRSLVAAPNVGKSSPSARTLASTGAKLSSRSIRSSTGGGGRKDSTGSFLLSANDVEGIQEEVRNSMLGVPDKGAGGGPGRKESASGRSNSNSGSRRSNFAIAHITPASSSSKRRIIRKDSSGSPTSPSLFAEGGVASPFEGAASGTGTFGGCTGSGSEHRSASVSSPGGQRTPPKDFYANAFRDNAAVAEDAVPKNPSPPPSSSTAGGAGTSAGTIKAAGEKNKGSGGNGSDGSPVSPSSNDALVGTSPSRSHTGEAGSPSSCASPADPTSPAEDAENQEERAPDSSDHDHGASDVGGFNKQAVLLEGSHNTAAGSPSSIQPNCEDAPASIPGDSLQHHERASHVSAECGSDEVGQSRRGSLNSASTNAALFSQPLSSLSSVVPLLHRSVSGGGGSSKSGHTVATNPIPSPKVERIAGGGGGNSKSLSVSARHGSSLEKVREGEQTTAKEPRRVHQLHRDISSPSSSGDINLNGSPNISSDHEVERMSATVSASASGGMPSEQDLLGGSSGLVSSGPIYSRKASSEKSSKSKARNVPDHLNVAGDHRIGRIETTSAFQEFHDPVPEGPSSSSNMGTTTSKAKAGIEAAQPPNDRNRRATMANLPGFPRTLLESLSDRTGNFLTKRQSVSSSPPRDLAARSAANGPLSEQMLASLNSRDQGSRSAKMSVSPVQLSANVSSAPSLLGTQLTGVGEQTQLARSPSTASSAGFFGRFLFGSRTATIEQSSQVLGGASKNGLGVVPGGTGATTFNPAGDQLQFGAAAPPSPLASKGRKMSLQLSPLHPNFDLAAHKESLQKAASPISVQNKMKSLPEDSDEERVLVKAGTSAAPAGAKAKSSAVDEGGTASASKDILLCSSGGHSSAGASGAENGSLKAAGSGRGSSGGGGGANKFKSSPNRSSARHEQAAPSAEHPDAKSSGSPTAPPSSSDAEINNKKRASAERLLAGSGPASGSSQGAAEHRELPQSPQSTTTAARIKADAGSSSTPKKRSTANGSEQKEARADDDVDAMVPHVHPSARDTRISASTNLLQSSPMGTAAAAGSTSQRKVLEQRDHGGEQLEPLQDGSTTNARSSISAPAPPSEQQGNNPSQLRQPPSGHSSGTASGSVSNSASARAIFRRLFTIQSAKSSPVQSQTLQNLNAVAHATSTSSGSNVKKQKLHRGLSSRSGTQNSLHHASGTSSQQAATGSLHIFSASQFFQHLRAQLGGGSGRNQNHAAVALQPGFPERYRDPNAVMRLGRLQHFFSLLYMGTLLGSFVFLSYFLHFHSLFQGLTREDSSVEYSTIFVDVVQFVLFVLAICAQLAAMSFFASPTFNTLAAYARRNGFFVSWAVKARRWLMFTLLVPLFLSAGVFLDEEGGYWERIVGETAGASASGSGAGGAGSAGAVGRRLEGSTAALLLPHSPQGSSSDAAAVTRTTREVAGAADRFADNAAAGIFAFAARSATTPSTPVMMPRKQSLPAVADSVVSSSSSSAVLEAEGILAVVPPVGTNQIKRPLLRALFASKSKGNKPEPEAPTRRTTSSVARGSRRLADSDSGTNNLISRQHVIARMLLSYVVWLCILNLVSIFFIVLDFCSLSLDAFALELVNSEVLDGLIKKFNILNAHLRRGAYAVQLPLVGYTTVGFGLMFLILHHFLQSQSSREQQSAAGTNSSSVSSDPTTASSEPAMQLSYCAILWVNVVIGLGLTLLNTIAMINIKCQRLPTLVNSLNFGLEIDYDRWCVAAHISACDAGFFVYNVRLAPASVLKFGYISLAVGLYLISRMVKLE